jgi:hypothetical protein
MGRWRMLGHVNRVRVVVVAATLLLAPAAAWCQAAIFREGGPEEAAFNGHSRDCGSEIDHARLLLTESSAQRRSEDDREWTMVANCALGEHDWPTAFGALHEITRSPRASGSAWISQIELGIQLDRSDDVARSVETLAKLHPDDLKSIAPDYFGNFLFREDAAGRTQDSLRVLIALDRIRYQPTDPLANSDDLWWTYARLLLDSGDVERARAMLARVKAPDLLLLASLDNRFAAIFADDDPAFDARAAWERQLASDQALMTAHPKALTAVLSVARDLRALERYSDALALLAAVKDRADRASRLKPAFTDQVDRLGWIETEEALDLRDLGRVEEAIAVDAQAAKLREFEGPNVSQVIALADLLNTVGKPLDALAALDVFDHGRMDSSDAQDLMAVHATRACADAQIGRQAELAQELKFLTDHQAERPSDHVSGLICANDLDGASAAYIAELAGVTERSDALLALSEFDPPENPTAVDTSLRSRLEQIRNRADVKAAIAKVGHNERVPLNGDVFANIF